MNENKKIKIFLNYLIIEKYLFYFEINHIDLAKKLSLVFFMT
jgi:hypothetical protein